MSQFPSFDLSGQVSLVTGAARGLGRSISLSLANAGSDLALGKETGWYPPGIRSGAIAVFHTHPSSSGLPSSPGDTAGGGTGDTGAAIDSKTDQYVISYGGLSVARASGPLKPGKHWDPWIIKGNGIDDWLKKLKKQCGM